MIETPQIVRTDEQQTAVIPFTIPRADMPKVMGPGIVELMDAIAAQGLAPTGAWYTYHRRMNPEQFDFELGAPVPSPIVSAGRVQPGQLPAVRVARTTYHGPYEGLGGAWEALGEWIASQGLRAAPELWECYVAGPESSGNPAEWRTELNRPLLD